MILKVENLSVLNNQKISFSLNAGEVLVIEGENGVGKTTLIKTILGLNHKFEGEVNFLINKDDISYLPQLANVQFFLPLRICDVLSLRQFYNEQQIEELGLLSKAQLLLGWNNASGGERQKAFLTSMFLKLPRLIVLDEPFNHLDKVSKIKTLNLIQSFSKKGVAFIIVAHDVSISGAKTINIEASEC